MLNGKDLFFLKFFYIENKLLKAVQPHVELRRANFKVEAPILQVQMIIYIIYSIVAAHWPVGIASPVGGHTSARTQVRV